MIYDYLLQHFTANDKFRPAMSTPDTQGRMVYASNSHILIQIPKTICEKEHRTEKAPNYESFFNETILSKIINRIKYKRNDLLKLVSLMKIKAKQENKTCGKCNGDGQITCTCCDNENDCKKCKGEGEVTDPNGFLIKDVWQESEDGIEEHIVMFNDIKFKPMYIELILFAMLAVGAEEGVFFNHEGNGKIFKFDYITIILMART